MPTLTESAQSVTLLEHRQAVIKFAVPYVVPEDYLQKVLLTHNDQQVTFEHWSVEVDDVNQLTSCSTVIADVTDSDSGVYVVAFEGPTFEHKHVIHVDTGIPIFQSRFCLRQLLNTKGLNVLGRIVCTFCGFSGAEDVAV